jgi:5-methylcytosine-specific restriction endonuclease McrA
MDTLILNSDGLPLSMLPVSMVDWKVAMRLVALEKVIVLHEHNDWSVRSPSKVYPVPSIVMTTDYVRWNRQVKYNRNNVFLRDNYTCQYCIIKMSRANLTIDHVLPRSLGGGTTWDNVTTACTRCNSNKGNNRKIVPNIKPRKPTYYELISKEQQKVLTVKDIAWLNYISWPDQNIKYNLCTTKRSLNDSQNKQSI